jgi:hypothetical protein
LSVDDNDEDDDDEERRRTRNIMPMITRAINRHPPMIAPTMIIINISVVNVWSLTVSIESVDDDDFVVVVVVVSIVDVANVLVGVFVVIDVFDVGVATSNETIDETKSLLV